MTFTYRWKLSELPPKKDIKVFSTFAGGGGSSMGYKMAGFDVVGCLEIDPKMNDIYKKNLNPKLNYCMDIRDFNKLDNLPEELFNLDILDGSPPCSSFSMNGKRERDWGKAKKFAEGQKLQTLDDLFFNFLDTVEILSPKVFIAENVKGLIAGNAKGYLLKIMDRINKLGYTAQVFLLNGASMGLPQKRERLFIAAHKSAYILKPLRLDFKEKLVSCEEAFEGINSVGTSIKSHKTFPYWIKTRPGESISKHYPKGHFYGLYKLHPKKPANTLTTSHIPLHWKSANIISIDACSRLSSFPDDYKGKSLFLLGMSVPPLMTYRVASEIERQWLSVL